MNRFLFYLALAVSPLAAARNPDDDSPLPMVLVPGIVSGQQTVIAKPESQKSPARASKSYSARQFVMEILGGQHQPAGNASVTTAQYAEQFLKNIRFTPREKTMIIDTGKRMGFIQDKPKIAPAQPAEAMPEQKAGAAGESPAAPGQKELKAASDFRRTTPKPAPDRASAKELAALVLAALACVLAVGLLSYLAIKKLASVRAAKGLILGRRYRVIRPLGEGGTGFVYEALDMTLNRKVAVKRVFSSHKLTAQNRERLLSEARTVAGLKHPNIADIYTIFEEDGDLYLVFEFVEGITLEETLRAAARLSCENARQIFKPVCDALEFAHSQNFTHRNIKPSNIISSGDGSVKLMDFGLARQASAPDSPTMTPCGTPGYMAPEQNIGTVRKESDIYSLGVCLYEALTGHIPWEVDGYDPNSARPIAPSKIIPNLPPSIDILIEKALMPDPEQRLSSAADFRALLLHEEIKTNAS